MLRPPKAIMLICLLSLAPLLAAIPAQAQQAASPDQAKEKEALDLGVEAYIYGYPW